MVAVLFAINEEPGIDNVGLENQVSENHLFEDLLKSLTLSQYLGFIKKNASKNRLFKIEFESDFANSDNRIDMNTSYKELIQKCIKIYVKRGFIDYSASSQLAKDIGRLLDIGYDSLNKKDFSDVMELGTSFLRPIMKAITHADDSRGGISDAINFVIDLLEDVAKADTSIDLKNQLFSFLRKELADTIYFDYGNFGYRLFDLLGELAITLNQHKIYLNYIDSKLSGLNGEYDRYQQEYYQKAKIDYLLLLGKNEEAEGLVKQNLHVVGIRQGQVDLAINKKDFVLAKELIAGGISLAREMGHPGTVNEWNKELLRIAELEQDIKKVRSYSEYFTFDHGFSELYYNKWKATFSDEEWAPIIENYIKITIEKMSSPYSSLLYRLGPVYIQEKYWDRLFLLVQQEGSLNVTLNHHKYLYEHFPQEMLKLYITNFETFGIQASARWEYADLVRKMKKVIKGIPGSEEYVLAVAHRLRERFSSNPRRPAMIEEFNKLLSPYA